ncbi:MAG TPA: hypothetical protein V6D17_16955 [Candidatus Obscuribacterales bacterium]
MIGSTKQMDKLDKQRREEQAALREQQRRKRNRSIIMHVLLTNVPTKTIAAKHGFKNAGNVREVTAAFCYRMKLRGFPEWEEWRKNRKNRTAEERQKLIRLLTETFGAEISEFQGW